MTNWTFITSHGAVFALIAKHREIKAIDIASELGITERSVRRIIADLVATGYVDIDKKGRVNRYRVKPALPLRRPESRDVKVGELLKALLPRE
jgi:predicted ArsR family transcriptional regulator